jgi:4,5-dihydroxyphthalate decarboxylase
MLVSGELDAVLHPDLIDPILDKNPNVARLFADHKNEEIAYYKKTQIFPIMHVMGLRSELVQKHPWIPVELYKAFEASKRIAMKRMENPRLVPLAWYREAWEEQEDVLGTDPWEYGMTDKNRHNLETLVQYSHEQGMMKNKMSLDDLFLNVEQGRKRGNFRV